MLENGWARFLHESLSIHSANSDDRMKCVSQCSKVANATIRADFSFTTASFRSYQHRPLLFFNEILSSQRPITATVRIRLRMCSAAEKLA